MHDLTDDDRARLEGIEVFTLTEQLGGSLKLSPHREGFALMRLIRSEDAARLLAQQTEGAQ